MREDLGPRLLEYLRAALPGSRVDFAEPLVPISGGFDTEISAFRLNGAEPALSGPLVLRVLGPHHDPLRALRERAVQNAVADMGFPAPRAPLACADPDILGGAFLVMERRPGRPPLPARPLGIAPPLVETHLRPPAVDPPVLVGGPGGGGPGSRALVAVEGHLGQLEARVSHNLRGLAPA